MLIMHENGAGVTLFMYSYSVIRYWRLLYGWSYIFQLYPTNIMIMPQFFFDD